MKNLTIHTIAVGGTVFLWKDAPAWDSPEALGKVVVVLRGMFGGRTHTDNFQFAIGQSAFRLESRWPNLSLLHCLGFLVSCCLEYAKEETSPDWALTQYIGETQP